MKTMCHMKEPEDGFSRPDDWLEGRQTKWGHCSICNIPLSSEQHAFDHVNSEQHFANEEAQKHRLPSKPSRNVFQRSSFGRFREVSPSIGQSSRVDSFRRIRTDELVGRKRHLSSDNSVAHRQVKRRSMPDQFERVSDDDYDDFADSVHIKREPEDNGTPGHDYRGFSLKPGEGADSSRPTRTVWIIGTEEMNAVHRYSNTCENYGPDFGLDRFSISITWHCSRGFSIKDVLPAIAKLKVEETKPQCIILHVGGNDLEKMAIKDFTAKTIEMIDGVKELFPDVKLVWSQMLPKSRGLNAARVAFDDDIATYILEANGHYIRYPTLELTDSHIFKMSKKGELELTTEGVLKMMPVLKGGIVSILNRNISIIPVLRNLPRKVSMFVQRNHHSKFKQIKKRVPFLRR